MLSLQASETNLASLAAIQRLLAESGFCNTDASKDVKCNSQFGSAGGMGDDMVIQPYLRGYAEAMTA
jgi:hypothetical protein